MSVTVLKAGNKLVPERLIIAGKLAPPLTPTDRFPEEQTHRTFLAQRQWFEVKRHKRSSYEHERRKQAMNFERQVIWKAFDQPEFIGILFNDACLRGDRSIFDPSGAWIDTALHWVNEARYWRCLGMTKPFFDDYTLRAHCWRANKMDVGNLQFNAAMTHAVMDMERALKRKAQGLDPSYVWDRWGPGGFIDGRRNDFLPRCEANPYVDPDGVEVTVEDVLPYITHEQLKERYGEFIFPDLTPFQGIFVSPSHGGLTLEDIPEPIREFYTKFTGGKSLSEAVDQGDMRALLHLTADDNVFKQIHSSAKSWEEVQASLASARAACDGKVDAARLAVNTTRCEDVTRRFFEEKCGWLDFMRVPDKTSTAAVLAYLQDLRSIVTSSDWGPPLCAAQSDREREKVLGKPAYAIYRTLEDAILERRRRIWGARFSGEAHEERSLDYMLQSFSRRAESKTTERNTLAEEFDREQEPIGRNVQRRVMDADIATDKGPQARQKPKADPFARLHRQQYTSGDVH